MREIFTTPDFSVVVGCDLHRWYFGIAYETLETTRAGVLRFGPVFLYLIIR